MRRPRVTLLTVLVLAGLLSPAAPAHAKAGDLDTAFDSDGKVTTTFEDGNARARAVTMQGDKILTAGGRGNSYEGLTLTRYTSDGALDPAFGSGGTVAASGGEANALTLQSDGRIVTAGEGRSGDTSDFALHRFSADGAADTGFGTSGTATAPFTGGATAMAVAMQSDGKIVAAGGTSDRDRDFAVARYTSDGKLDPSFGAGGLVTTKFSAQADEAHAVAVQSDGGIVVAGLAEQAFGLARYTSDGKLDTTFGTGGKVTTAFSRDEDEDESRDDPDWALAVVIQADGAIVAAGRANKGDAVDAGFALARYTTDGKLDPTFSSDGKVVERFGGTSRGAYGVAVQPDQKIVAVGSMYASSDIHFALVRYQPDGTPDPDFGSGGKVTTGFGAGNDCWGLGIAVQPADRKIVTVGRAGSDIALARYNP